MLHFCNARTALDVHEGRRRRKSGRCRLQYEDAAALLAPEMQMSNT
jgi:hypothetical protein